jgi:hypothetical protein
MDPRPDGGAASREATTEAREAMLYQERLGVLMAGRGRFLVGEPGLLLSATGVTARKAAAAFIRRCAPHYAFIVEKAAGKDEIAQDIASAAFLAMWDRTPRHAAAIDEIASLCERSESRVADTMDTLVRDEVVVAADGNRLTGPRWRAADPLAPYALRCWWLGEPGDTILDWLAPPRSEKPHLVLGVAETSMLTRFPAGWSITNPKIRQVAKKGGRWYWIVLERSRNGDPTRQMRLFRSQEGAVADRLEAAGLVVVGRRLGGVFLYARAGTTS